MAEADAIRVCAQQHHLPRVPCNPGIRNFTEETALVGKRQKHSFVGAYAAFLEDNYG